MFRLDDGDMITVDSVLERFENKIEVSGAVYCPGLYQLNGECVNTVKQLIKSGRPPRGCLCEPRFAESRARRLYARDVCHRFEQTDEWDGGGHLRRMTIFIYRAFMI